MEEHWFYNCPNTQIVCKYTKEILDKIYPDKTFENTKRFFLMSIEKGKYKLGEICLETLYDPIYYQRNALTIHQTQINSLQYLNQQLTKRMFTEKMITKNETQKQQIRQVIKICTQKNMQLTNTVTKVP